VGGALLTFLLGTGIFFAGVFLLGLEVGASQRAAEQEAQRALQWAIHRER
jgi:hypothetical protein